MLRLLLVCTFACYALGDVSHLLRTSTFGSSRPFGGFPAPIPVARIPTPRLTTFGSSAGPVPNSGRHIGIVRQTQDVEPDGSYQFSFETENGIAAEERGQIRAAGNDVEKAAQGSFSWISPEGEKVSVQYLADGNGYQPQGSHLPVAPPIPPAILRSLEWNAAHPEEEQQVYGGQKRLYN